jgi:hypothetical protein
MRCSNRTSAAAAALAARSSSRVTANGASACRRTWPTPRVTSSNAGITDPNRVCINGWSYGGYVAFTASFMNADIFKCSVAGAGVSDLRAMLRWVRSGDRGDVQGGGGGGGAQLDDLPILDRRHGRSEP